MKYGIYAALAGIALMAAAPASATISSCNTSFPDPDAIACAGYYSGNLLSGADAAQQLAALQSIGYSGSFDGTNTGWTALVNGGNVLSGLNGASVINFGKTLYGITYIGMHFGNINDPPTSGNVSVFWEFDFGSAGASSITLASGRGSSNLAIYSTGSGVPEPATWAMMLVGFAGVGFAMRRKQKASGELLQLA